MSRTCNALAFTIVFCYYKTMPGKSFSDMIRRRMDTKILTPGTELETDKDKKIEQARDIVESAQEQYFQRQYPNKFVAFLAKIIGGNRRF